MGYRLAIALFALFALPADAQVLYGTVLGAVRDSSGAVVPNATVAITNQQTNQTRNGATNAVGLYNFTNVLQGLYKLEVTATGFQPFAQTDVQVTINTVSRIDVELRVGQISETLTVSAAAAVLQADKADVHVDLAAREVTTLPLPSYRNYQSLINLVPGATPAQFQNAINDTPARSLYTNINGTVRNSNNTRVDGALNKYNNQYPPLRQPQRQRLQPGHLRRHHQRPAGSTRVSAGITAELLNYVHLRPYIRWRYSAVP